MAPIYSLFMEPSAVGSASESRLLGQLLDLRRISQKVAPCASELGFAVVRLVADYCLGVAVFRFTTNAVTSTITAAVTSMVIVATSPLFARLVIVLG